MSIYPSCKIFIRSVFFILLVLELTNSLSSDTFNLLYRNIDNNLIIQSVFTNDVYELEVDKIKELELV